MTGPEHYLRAEALIVKPGESKPERDGEAS